MTAYELMCYSWRKNVLSRAFVTTEQNRVKSGRRLHSADCQFLRRITGNWHLYPNSKWLTTYYDPTALNLLTELHFRGSGWEVWLTDYKYSDKTSILCRDSKPHLRQITQYPQPKCIRIAETSIYHTFPTLNHVSTYTPTCIMLWGRLIEQHRRRRWLVKRTPR